MRLTKSTSGLWVLSLGLLVSANSAAAQLVGIDRDTGNLYEIATSDASLSLIGSTGIAAPGPYLGSLEFAADGFLYGVTTSANAALPTLYRINPTNAATVPVGTLGVSAFEGGLTFDGQGTAYATNSGTSGSALLYTLNMGTGAAAIVGTLAIAGPGGTSISAGYDINGLGTRSDGMLVGIDRVSNSLLLIDPTTALTTLLAPLGPTAGGIGGLVVNGNVGYFVTAGVNADTPGTNELYSFDPFTGAHTAIGMFDNNQIVNGFSGLAYISEPASVALLAFGALAMLRRRK